MCVGTWSKRIKIMSRTLARIFFFGTSFFFLHKQVLWFCKFFFFFCKLVFPVLILAFFLYCSLSRFLSCIHFFRGFATQFLFMRLDLFVWSFLVYWQGCSSRCSSLLGRGWLALSFTSSETVRRFILLPCSGEWFGPQVFLEELGILLPFLDWSCSPVFLNFLWSVEFAGTGKNCPAQSRLYRFSNPLFFLHMIVFALRKPLAPLVSCI